jgi:hypothetical protein
MNLSKVWMLLFLILGIAPASWAIGSYEIKDTYFNRFFYQSIIEGGSTPGKFNLDYNSGRENLTYGLIGDIPMNFSFVPWKNVSQTMGMFVYKFEDNFGPKGLGGTKDTVLSASLTALNLSYGINAYQLPFRTNAFAGLNLYLGREGKIMKDGIGLEQRRSIFSVAPYVYFINPWNERLTTQTDVMVSHDYKDLAKLALKVLLRQQNWNIRFTTERNGSAFSDSYENSFTLSKKIPAIWWLKNIGGIFYKPMREMEADDPETIRMMQGLDKMFGHSAGYLTIKAGSAFEVNNLVEEKFTDKLGKADNYFIKAEGAYIFGGGLSYKVENGLGFKFGINYGLNFGQMGLSQPGNTAFFDLSNKNMYVALELLKNYINDDLFGLRVDPGMLLRVNLGIR